MSFTVTKLPGAVQSIRVVVKTSSGTVLKDSNLAKISETSYKTDAFYTFTADGSYIIEGYVVMSTKSLQKMSIFGDIGGNTAPFVWPFSVLRSLVIVVGAVFTIEGLRKRRGAGV